MKGEESNRQDAKSTKQEEERKTEIRIREYEKF